MKNKISFLLLLCSFTLALNAKEAICLDDKSNPTISWQAYKTPLKAGVWGNFTSIKRTGQNKKENLEALLVGQKVNIDSTKVSTKDESRDENIVDTFFKKMAATEISGVISSVKKDVATVELILNKKKKPVPFKVTNDGKEIVLTGHIDVLDFALSGALNSLNERCFALHEGKTWSDVMIKITQPLKTCP